MLFRVSKFVFCITYKDRTQRQEMIRYLKDKEHFYERNVTKQRLHDENVARST